MDRENKHLLLFGIHPVLEMLRTSPQEVFEVLVAGGHPSPALRSIGEEARRRNLRVRYVEPRELDRLAAGCRHQGVIAKVSSYSYRSFADLLGDVTPAAGHDWILAVDRVTDPRNFGALLRSAEGVGIRRVVIPKDRSAGVTPTVVKSSAGAAHYLGIYRVPNLRRALQDLKARGYWVVGLDAGAKEDIYGRVYPEKLVVVLGSEGTGIRPLIRQECDFLVSIPMRGQIASLNVAVAGGVFFYELLRQRGSAKN